MKVDYIFPYHPHDWEGPSFARAFREAGVLNKAIAVVAGREFALFDYLRSSASDVVMFAAADHHMPYLLDTEEKRNILRGMPQLKLLHSGEPIAKSRIPWAIEMTSRALDCFDLFTFSYEDDAIFFKDLILDGRATLCMFAADEDLFHPRLALSDRVPRLMFNGKATDFGLTSHGVYGLRIALLKVLVESGVVDAVYEPECTADQLVDIFNSHIAIINLPGLGENINGFSRKVFECLACRTLLLQPRQSPASFSRQVFKDGHEYLSYDSTSPDLVIEFARQLTKNLEIVGEIADQGYRAFLAAHTVRIRVRSILRFCENRQPIHDDFISSIS